DDRPLRALRRRRGRPQLQARHLPREGALGAGLRPGGRDDPARVCLREAKPGEGPPRRPRRQPACDPFLRGLRLQGGGAPDSPRLARGRLQGPRAHGRASLRLAAAATSLLGCRPTGGYNPFRAVHSRAKEARAMTVTIHDLEAWKQQGQRFVMLTAYDYPTARILDAAGIPVILVGDSLGQTVLGYETTLPV